jgi:hypothetical protein
MVKEKLEAGMARFTGSGSAAIAGIAQSAKASAVHLIAIILVPPSALFVVATLTIARAAAD